MTTIELPPESDSLLGVVRTALTGDVPNAALIGGLGRHLPRRISDRGVLRQSRVLANLVKSAASMASTQGTAVSPDDVAQTMDAFVEDLEDPRVNSSPTEA